MDITVMHKDEELFVFFVPFRCVLRELLTVQS